VLQIHAFGPFKIFVVVPPRKTPLEAQRQALAWGHAYVYFKARTAINYWHKFRARNTALNIRIEIYSNKKTIHCKIY